MTFQMGACGCLAIVLPLTALGDTNAVLLQTGTGTVLARSNLLFHVPTNLLAASLRFDLAFATDEQPVPGEFSDSWTVSLRNSDRSYVAPVVTVDLFGATWRPSGSAGQTFEGMLLVEPASPPAAGAGRAVQSAYRVALEVPLLLLGPLGGTLVLSLFDNLDSEASLGLLQNLEVGPSLRESIVVESSASAAGPYALEGGAIINRVHRRITLPGGGVGRFYRLRADGPSRIQRMRLTNRELIFDYDTNGSRVALESSARVAGPFALESGVVNAPEARQLRIAPYPGSRFYRLRSDTPLKILRVERQGADVILYYDLP
jgi:hypothetical protein